MCVHAHDLESLANNCVPYKPHGTMCAVVIHMFVSLRHSRLLPCAIPTSNSYYTLSERCAVRGVQ